MFEKEKRELINAGMMLDRYGLIALSGGNLSIRTETGEILMTPSGMMYETLVEDDIVVMDMQGNIVEGKRKPSVDGIAIRYIFEKRPDVHAVIHTHQPCATALGLVQDVIPCNLTTLANAAKGHVHVAPYSSAASLDMGVKTVEYIGESLAVVLKHHGVVAVGSSLKEALYACVYLEEACHTLLYAMSTGKDIASLNQQQINDAVEVFKHYGQGK